MTKWIVDYGECGTLEPRFMKGGRQMSVEAAAWYMDELEARQHVATVLPPDPYDERSGLWLSSADLRALKALPSGTKLYASTQEQTV